MHFINRRQRNNGFTLLELLIVIAIIGILASIILASLSTIRTRAKEVSMKGQLKILGTEAELIYATVGAYADTYYDLCSGGWLSPNMREKYDNIQKFNGWTLAENSVLCMIKGNGKEFFIFAAGIKPPDEPYQTALNLGGYCIDWTTGGRAVKVDSAAVAKLRYVWEAPANVSMDVGAYTCDPDDPSSYQ